jgi:uncharacterized protein (DUF1778 family)
VPQSTRSIIERAAALYGATINQFIVQAAVERANEVLKNVETLRLSSRDAQLFMDALAKPPQPNNELMDAIRKAAGVAGLFVDSKNPDFAVFYRKFGFIPLQDNPLSLMLTHQTILGAFTDEFPE